MIGAVLQVAAGGALGAVARFLAVRGALAWFGPGFPWGTFIVNVLGGFVMGLLAVWLEARGLMRWAPFFLTGILGGFTTFSAFTIDAFLLWERGAVGLAAVYVLGSVALSLAGLVLGVLLMRGMPA
ncbi:fluoride efflux transporter CrcB [Ruixingdingia sedimenti]|uniref:Fluoride-specific ion channel FluC n=1 Tax=Ruixingdingia sedimenti TaxID=3073604 RepID=A0ABU1FEH2_9RHOB|nr:fluoride efflux transporter CrcB [Xinfangfangia sp. LG-4]MDR5654767.1 fluoride efflux transporter CrcB [Xinfangfangia sp. LG-4]